MNKSDDIIRNLINNSDLKSASKGQLTKEDIQKRLKNVDRKMAMDKLKSMGLGPLADKLKNISDDELIKIISNNPSILKKLNNYLK